MNKKRIAVFIDLQGTLGGDGMGDIMDFQFYPFSIEAIKLLNENNIFAIVVTNQSRIAGGFLTIEDFNKRLHELVKELSLGGAHFDAAYCCPHSRHDGCECKKPLPGMLNKAKDEFNINLEESYVIGDMGISDMVMAKAVGAKAILVRTGAGEGSLKEFRHTWADIEPDLVVGDVLEGVRWIIKPK